MKKIIIEDYLFKKVSAVSPMNHLLFNLEIKQYVIISKPSCDRYMKHKKKNCFILVHIDGCYKNINIKTGVIKMFNIINVRKFSDRFFFVCLYMFMLSSYKNANKML